ncbi:hypothetical protein DCAR_0521795 [Daucus carota subsp. sativus]|uniref:Uncharacterized protein n=1 Tax=Daucus carota subsp. sativus TaxID=79200 RepID=A0A164ZE82_DAUCS|nr:PREDICTED: uncharacterized protein LOC108220646 [Daucus carota subsp. sativus]WOH02406.1 hypothetical protein DCAR_0521795 [Daucus carota subsp. sativus]
MGDSNAIIVNNKENQETPTNPNPFVSLLTNFTKFFNFPQPKSAAPNPEAKPENPKSKAPVVVAYPSKQTAAPLKLEAEDLEKNTNPVVLWQVYAIGGFFVLKWAWARYNERRAKKKTNDDPPPADD